MLSFFIPIIITAFRFFTISAPHPQPPVVIEKVEAAVPKAEHKIEKNKGQQFVVKVQPNGKILIKNQEHTLEGLEAEMTKLAKIDKNTAVRIEGHRDTKYKTIVQVIDNCRNAGIWNISFTTRAPK